MGFRHSLLLRVQVSLLVTERIFFIYPSVAFVVYADADEDEDADADANADGDAYGDGALAGAIAGAEAPPTEGLQWLRPIALPLLG